MLDGWYRDAVFGLRSLRRSPVFCATAVLTLAIGIGANTAVFTLLHGLLLRSLAVASPHRLVRITQVSPEGRSGNLIPYRMWRQFRAEQRSFVDVLAWRESHLTVADRDGTPRQQPAGLASGNAFAVLGLRPHLGRLLVEADDVPGGPAEGWPVVLGHGFWRDRFASDPRVIGTTMTVAKTVVTIVGVMPASFEGLSPGTETKLYLPLRFMPIASGRDDLDLLEAAVPVSAIGRLKPGVSWTQARAEIAAAQRRLLDEFTRPDLKRQPGFRVMALQLQTGRRGLPTFFGVFYARPLYQMQGLVAVVLLLCCINVSGLMLAKTHERQHEFAVRRAMGAGRGRLLRQYLTESFIIAAAGTALGGLAAWWGSALLLTFFRDPNMTGAMTIEPDRTILAVTAVCAVLTTLVVGTLPAWRAGDVEPRNLLGARGAARGATGGRVFVALQIALSLVLVTLASLLSQSLGHLRSEEVGFAAERVTLQAAPFHQLRLSPSAQLDLYQRIVDRLEQSPGVSSAAMTWYTPMTGVPATARFEPLAGEAATSSPRVMVYSDVGPGYFETMGTAVVEGREFDRRERDRQVCVLNRSAARALFPRQQAVDRYVRSADVRAFPEAITCRVVGIVDDVRFGTLREPPPRTIYFPVNEETIRIAGNLNFLMNTRTPADASAAYRAALRELAPSMPVLSFITLRDQIEALLGSDRALAMLTTLFAGIALLLSAIGLYGMLSSNVTQRTGEIGIRVALGASRAAVLRMVLTDAVRLVAAGLLLGGVVLMLAAGAMARVLHGVSAFDPVTVTAATGLLTLVALLAALLPARRAASVDPMRAMRANG